MIPDSNAGEFTLAMFRRTAAWDELKSPQLSRNTLNTNLMHGHRDSSVSPCSLPEITEHRFFHVFILLQTNKAKRNLFCTYPSCLDI